MYLHELGEDEASFTKDEMQAGKHQDYEQKLVEQYLTPQVTHTNTQTTNRSTPVNGPPTPSIPETVTSTTTGSGGITVVKPPGSR